MPDSGPGKVQTTSVPVLEYRTPLPPKRPRILELLRSWGPWWPRPSNASIVLAALLAGAVVALAYRPLAWTPGRSITNVARLSYSSKRDFVPLPLHDAVFHADSNGSLVVTRLWDGTVLARCVLPAGVALKQPVCLSASKDESKLVGQIGGDVLIWDANSGAILRHLFSIGGNSYLNAPGLTLPGIYAVAISSDGSKVAAESPRGLLTVWDITGSTARLLGRRDDLGHAADFDPYIEFSPQGSCVLIADRQNARVLRSDSLATVIETMHWMHSPSDWGDLHWMNGDKNLLVRQPDFQRNGNVMFLYDSSTGELKTQFPVPGSHETPFFVTQGGRRAFIPGDYLSSTDVTIAKDGSASVVRSHGGWLAGWGDFQFFPDGQRAVASSGSVGGGPMIMDESTDVQLDPLPLPLPLGGGWNPFPPVVNVVVSADSKHIAARLADGRVQIYDQIGPESRWGMLASPRFFLTGVTLAFLLASLWRDARRAAVRSRANHAAAILVIASFFPLLYFCGLLACGQTTHYDWDSSNVPWYALLLTLPAGLGIRGGSPFWQAVGRLVLAYMMVASFLVLLGTMPSHREMYQIFDRSMRVPPMLLPAVAFTVMMISTVTLVRTLRD